MNTDANVVCVASSRIIDSFACSSHVVDVLWKVFSRNNVSGAIQQPLKKPFSLISRSWSLSQHICLKQFQSNLWPPGQNSILLCIHLCYNPRVNMFFFFNPLFRMRWHRADPGFKFRGGGGAQKIMCPHANYERGTELTFGRGPCRARLRALEALGLF